MNRKIIRLANTKNLLILVLSVFILTSLYVAPLYAIEPGSPTGSACEGIGGCAGDSGNRISSLLAEVINLLSWIVGIASVIMVIVGGFKFIVSSGDPNGAKSAKNTVIYALVGLAVAALAQVLVRFVLSQVT